MIATRLSKKEIFVGLSLLFGLFLPHTSTFLLMVNPVLCVIFYLKFSYKTNLIYPYKFLLLSSLFLSLIFNLGEPGAITVKVILSFVYFCMLIFCFPLVTDVKIRNVFLFISVIIILFSQLVYVVRFYPAIAIIDNLYPMSDMYSNIYSHIDGNINITNISSFRLGGLYRNPNHLAKYVNLLTVIFILCNRNEKLSKKIIFYLIVLLSIILSGSRTGFVVLLLLLSFDILLNWRTSKTQKIFIFIAFCAMLSFFALGDFGFRGLKVQEGMSNSAGSKLEVLEYYLMQDNSFIEILFGNLNPDTFSAPYGIIDQFDAEYGYLIYQYGFVGFISYIIFWIAIFKSYPHNNRLLFFIMLWTISSTIMLAYRSAFVMMLAFSIYYKLEFDESNKTTNNHSN